jgi:uncharacterized phiE125 gp8 family phage protein
MPLSLQRTVDATTEPVTLAEAKTHLRVVDTAEDDYITALIGVARQHAEMLTGRQFITGTFTLTLDRFPGYFGDITLPRPSLIGVSSITYIDLDGATQTVSPALYQVDAQSQPGRLRPAYAQSWPTAKEQMNCVTITFTAGFGAAASNVPKAIKQAVLLLVSQWFENREPLVIGTIVAQVPMTVDALLGPYRSGMVY